MFDRFLDIVLLCNITKTVAQVFSSKEVFLEISQSSQENSCARISILIKLKTCNFIKIETMAQVFSCEFCEIYRKNFSYRTPPVTASNIINVFNCLDLHFFLAYLEMELCNSLKIWRPDLEVFHQRYALKEDDDWWRFIIDQVTYVCFTNSKLIFDDVSKTFKSYYQLTFDKGTY